MESHHLAGTLLKPSILALFASSFGLCLMLINALKLTPLLKNPVPLPLSSRVLGSLNLSLGHGRSGAGNARNDQCLRNCRRFSAGFPLPVRRKSTPACPARCFCKLARSFRLRPSSVSARPYGFSIYFAHMVAFEVTFTRCLNEAELRPAFPNRRP